VRFSYGRRIQSVEKEHDAFVLHARGERIRACSVVIATGGVTWPHTGSTGDGYKFASAFGHTVVQPRACLAPLITTETWPGQLAGVGVENAAITAKVGNRKFCTSGPMLFTSDGIGGPAVLDLSRLITDFLPSATCPIKLNIDLMPQYDPCRLDREIIRLCTSHSKKELASVLAMLLPRSLMLNLTYQLNLSATMLAGKLPKTQRRQLTNLLKRLSLSIKSVAPVSQATVTRGGVCADEINPKTMESKLCRGLFFAGEVINVDGPCGGFNLQIAFSTGRLAGKMAAARKR